MSGIKPRHFSLSLGAMLLMLGLSSQASAGTFYANGSVYTSAGLSGNAATSNSFAGLNIYRYNIASQLGVYPNGVSATAISPASGNTQVAEFAAFDVGDLNAWTTSVAAGETMVAVAETRIGQFGWSGPSYVYFSNHVITATEFSVGSAVFPSGNSQAIPQPLTIAVASNAVTLQWPNLSDPTGALSSYSVYRSLAPPAAPNLTYSASSLLGSTAVPVTSSSNVTFVDTTVAPNQTYYYTIAPNFIWTGGSSSDVGANPNFNYYTTFAQSITISATTPLIPANLVATWIAPAGASTGQVFTIELSVTNTGNVSTVTNISPTAAPIVTNNGSGSVSQINFVSPAGAVIPGNSAQVFTYTYSATGNGTVFFSATAAGDGLSSTTNSAAVTIAPGALLLSSINVTPKVIYNSIGPVNVTVTSTQVLLTVTNTGSTTALDVYPLAPPTEFAVSGTLPIAGLVTSPSAAVNLPGGASTTFTFTYTGAGSGIVNFQGQAGGTDQNTGLFINSTSTVSPNLKVATGDLNVFYDSVPINQAKYETFSDGEAEQFSVEVENEFGGSTAFEVSPTVKVDGLRYGVPGGTASPLLLSGPNPIEFDGLTNSQEQSFTYSFSVTGQGTFQFGAHALATTTAGTLLGDFSPYYTGSLSPSITFETAANLTVSAFNASALLVNVGQVITVTLTVADVGQDTASSVAPILYLN